MKVFTEPTVKYVWYGEASDSTYGVKCTRPFESFFIKKSKETKGQRWVEFKNVDFGKLCGELELSKPVLKVTIDYGSQVSTRSFTNGRIFWNNYLSLSEN